MSRLGKDNEWNIYEKGTTTWDKVPIAVLMDIRDELKRLNTLLHCGNFLRIPYVLDRISDNTKKRKPRRKKKAVKS